MDESGFAVFPDASDPVLGLSIQPRPKVAIGVSTQRAVTRCFFFMRSCRFVRKTDQERGSATSFAVMMSSITYSPPKNEVIGKIPRCEFNKPEMMMSTRRLLDPKIGGSMARWQP